MNLVHVQRIFLIYSELLSF